MTPERIAHWAGVKPDSTALVYNDRSFSYRQFAGAIAGARDMLAASTPPGDGLAIILGAGLLDAWRLTFAARLIGLTTVAVPSLANLAPLALKDASCIIAPQAEKALATQRHGAAPDARLIIVPGMTELAQGRSIAPDRPLGGHILYTSGTTGAYKKLLFAADKEAARNQAQADASNYTPSSVFHALDFGLWTAIGYKSSSATWHVGGCVVIDQRPQRYAAFGARPITHSTVLPESLRTIVAARAAGASPADGLRLRVAGGFTPLRLAEAALATVSRRLVVGYSATELAQPVMDNDMRAPEDSSWLQPRNPDAVEIVDEWGQATAPGVEGELRIRLTELDADGYLDDAEATARAFKDGFFHPGDMAVRGEDGRVRIAGRIADVINVRGQKLAVGPIEERLQHGLGVAEVCLFSHLARDGVEELVVAVRADAPVTPAEVSRRLGGSVIFDRVRVEVLADFPRTHTGKTRRIELRRMLFGNEANPGTG